MKTYDEIEVVEKNVVEIVEVEKFNPFHDARGRFSNKNGFASYSANPNTRAGAMAISRSAAAGHGNTANVHRESYGENIQQNAKWMGSGKQLGRGNSGYNYMRNRVERTGGLAGASRTGASWQAQNQQQGRKTTAGKNPPKQQGTANKPAQQATKPAAAKPTQPQQQPQKPAQQAQQQPSGRKMVDGKDISSTFSYNPRSKGSALDQVAEQQGYKGKPQVIKSKSQFEAAAKASGLMAFRTVNGGTDVVTGKQKTSKQFADDIKNSDTFSHNGNGMRVYGGGMYIAATQNPVKGKTPSQAGRSSAIRDSKMYGGSSSTTLSMTLDPSAKVGDFRQMSSDFNRLSRGQRAKYGNDVGAYAASKGYDALKATNAGWNCDYITVYNRTKLIVYDG